PTEASSAYDAGFVFGEPRTARGERQRGDRNAAGIAGERRELEIRLLRQERHVGCGVDVVPELTRHLIEQIPDPGELRGRAERLRGGAEEQLNLGRGGTGHTHRERQVREQITVEVALQRRKAQ